MSEIIQVTSWLSNAGGGIPPVIRSLVAEFRRQSSDGLIAGLADPAGAPPIFPADWPVISGRITGPAAFGFSPDLARQLRPRIQKNSVLHVHGLWMYPGWLARKLAAAAGVPRIVSPHGMLDPWALKNSRGKKRLAAGIFENQNLRTAGCLHALSEAEAGGFRELGLKNPVAVIPNGIELPDAGRPTSAGPPPPWQDFVRPGQKVLLFLSRIHPKKGLINLLKAWASLKASPWTLAIAGWDQGGHEQQLKLLAVELGLNWSDIRESGVAGGKPESTFAAQNPCSVLFLGPQFDASKSACFEHCDGFILPSASEGVPMVVLEAWAHGRPVLMTPACNLPAGFERGAAVCIETDAGRMAQGLREFFEMSDAQRRTLGDNGRRLARERFAWPQLAQEMKRVYDWLRGGGSPPGCVV